MTVRTYVRLISGGLCLVAAVAIALMDFFKDFEHHETAHVPQESAQEMPPTPHPDEGTPDEEVCTNEDGDPCPVDETLQVMRGDTLSTVLERAKIDSGQAHDVIEALKSVFNPRDLRPDHEIYITYIPVKGAPLERDLISLYIRPSLETEITVERQENGRYKATQETKELTHTTEVVKGEIHDSLYLDAGKQGVPAKVLHEMIKAFSYDVDFQRSFHPGDGYGLIYDTYRDPESLKEVPGELAFAYLRLKDKELRLYYFKPKKGNPGFYDINGASVRKGLLRTPVDGARLSSGFGMRRHPVLGFSKMHKGVDFAAPKGTPIMAAGDGVVEKMGPFSSYGNYIRLRHNSEISTAYAHMSRFAAGLRVGKSVRQGQVIGYIGMTGRTTGPHLHYELLKHGKQVDPKHIKTMPAGKLMGADLTAFKNLVAGLNQKFESYVPPVTEIAAEDEVVSEDGDENVDPKTLEAEQYMPTPAPDGSVSAPGAPAPAPVNISRAATATPA